jgi:hypothetical protein
MYVQYAAVHYIESIIIIFGEYNRNDSCYYLLSSLSEIHELNVRVLVQLYVRALLEERRLLRVRVETGFPKYKS